MDSYRFKRGTDPNLPGARREAVWHLEFPVVVVDGEIDARQLYGFSTPQERSLFRAQAITRMRMVSAKDVADTVKFAQVDATRPKDLWAFTHAGVLYRRKVSRDKTRATKWTRVDQDNVQWLLDKYDIFKFDPATAATANRLRSYALRGEFGLRFPVMSTGPGDEPRSYIMRVLDEHTGKPHDLETHLFALEAMATEALTEAMDQSAEGDGHEPVWSDLGWRVEFTDDDNATKVGDTRGTPYMRQRAFDIIAACIEEAVAHQLSAASLA
jgi:hypothetical protein